ncbi:DUF1289 domain-containing protein [Parasalinivibrio latis]|uniref:DUF1289 domain-containing protein n=1 Tax=Parasalinivibrio latis TaxID=2952610 RepID=UPI0030DE9AE0
MEQLEFFNVPSPCIGVCQVNNKGYCKGCLRSRDERFYWNQFTDTQKRDVLRLCKQRKVRILRALRARELALHEQNDNPQGDLFG